MRFQRVETVESRFIVAGWPPAENAVAGWCRLRRLSGFSAAFSNGLREELSGERGGGKKPGFVQALERPSSRPEPGSDRERRESRCLLMILNRLILSFCIGREYSDRQKRLLAKAQEEP